MKNIYSTRASSHSPFFFPHAKTKWNRLRYIRFTRARKGRGEIAKMNHRLWLSAPNTLTTWKFIVHDLPASGTGESNVAVCVCERERVSVRL